MTTASIIVLAIWFVGIFVAYFGIIRKWNRRTTFEKIWFSIFWPTLIILYPVHYLWNKYKSSDDE